MTDEASGTLFQPPPPAQPAAPPVAWAPPAPAGPAPGVEWGGYGARLGAYLLDGLIVGLASLATVIVSDSLLTAAVALGVGDVLYTVVALLGSVLLIGVPIAYFPFYWSHGGRTPGMKAVGLRVVRDRDGGPVGTASAIVRLIGMVVSAVVLYLGFIWVFLDGRRRGWHDLLAGTVVIKDLVAR